jgi:hypothetical protein
MIAASVVLIAATFFGYGLDVQPQTAGATSQVKNKELNLFKSKSHRIRWLFIVTMSFETL